MRPCDCRRRQLTPPLSQRMKEAVRVFASQLRRSQPGIDVSTSVHIANGLARDGKLTPSGKLKAKKKVARADA